MTSEEAPTTTNDDARPDGVSDEKANAAAATAAVAEGPHKNESPQKAEGDEEEKKDEEGLLLQYDVILCGTGLVQSILASALTRAGKTVLHCDGNDYYGELDSVYTFDYLNEIYSNNQKNNDNKQQREEDQKEEKEETKTTTNTRKIIPLALEGSNQNFQFHSLRGCNKKNFPITKIGTKVKTSYGEGTVTGKTLPTATTTGRLEITLSNWNMADGKSPIVYYGVTSLSQLKGNNNNNDNKSPPEDDDDIMEEYFQSTSQEIQSVRYLSAMNILQKQSRSLALDVTPSLLFANGVGVQGLLTSNVAEHLEFQTMQGMYWLELDNDSDSKNKKSSSNKLERVPCNKGDVMQSSLLPPLDKRRFMKFFQSAMDYATERELNKEREQLELEQQQQRLLKEEKEEANGEKEGNNGDNNEATTEEGVLSLNERQLNQGRSLARPQNKAMAKKDLQVLYDCMEQDMDFDTYLDQQAKLSPRLRNLIRHALALEMGGSSNSVSTKQGMERLCDHLKALGRFGTTAFLTPLYGSGELSQFFCRSAAVYGATYLLRRTPLNVTIDLARNKVDGVTMGATAAGGFGGPTVPEKHIRANHVILAQDCFSSRGKPMTNNTKQQRQRRVLRRISVLRGTTLIPGGDTRSVLIIPPSPKHAYPIHGLLLDETTRVAPRGCSVLHLTTAVNEGEGEIVEKDNVLEQAARVLLKQQQSTSEEVVDEIFHTTFSYGLEEEDDTSNETEGLHWVQRSAMPLLVDEAFEQAKRIFARICGGPEENLEFLALSDAMQTKLKEQLKDAYRGPNQVEDDTEQVALDSAMEMLQEDETTTSSTQEQQLPQEQPPE